MTTYELSNRLPPTLTLFDMGFFVPSVMCVCVFVCVWGGGRGGRNFVFRGILFQISCEILLWNTFKILLYGNIWNNNFRKSQVLPDKLVAMVTPDNLGNQK